jgi:hypothetical protein
LSIALIIGPPPCTTTGFTLHLLHQHVAGEARHGLVVAHGVAAELDDDRASS